jgi:hypothetical protein
MKALTMEERYDALKAEYHLIRAALRAGLSDEQNAAHPGSVDKIRFLISERDTLKLQYAELVDALCSKLWLGRKRHTSVVALAKRLHDSQRTLRPLELEDVALAAGYCIRKSGHEGPCNGLPRNDCFQGAKS